MDTMARAFETLRQAETSLRDLASTAVATSDYASVVQIASWARTLSELIKAPVGRETGTSPSPALQMRRGIRAAKPVTVANRRATRTARQHDYPRFFRKDDQLVRIAWSKREKKEYQHKAPRSVLQSLGAAMAKLGSDGRIFSTDQLLPLQDQTDGTDIPNYQAYVGIAFLKQAGLIDQHGRQGYSISRLSDFADSIESVWRKLPQR